MGKKILAVFLVICYCFSSIGAMPVATTTIITAEQFNTDVDEYAQKLQSKYLLYIKYPTKKDGYYAVGTPSLSTLDTSLSYLSEDFVKELSQYYYDHYGRYLTIEFAYLSDDKELDSAALGKFSSETATIQLFIPTGGKKMTMTGCSPFTILHEMGHAYHLVLSNHFGYNNLKVGWSQMNNPLGYTFANKQNPDKNIFVSLYSSQSYEEDFAETFVYAFGTNRSGLGLGKRLSNGHKPTGLGKKITYISNSLTQVFSNTAKAQQCLATTRKTPSILYYSGSPLSGNSLEFIGLNAPNGILDNVLAELKIQATKSDWVSTVGGWKVSDDRGGIYLVFPGSMYVTLQIPARSTAS